MKRPLIILLALAIIAAIPAEASIFNKKKQRKRNDKARTEEVIIQTPAQPAETETAAPAAAAQSRIRRTERPGEINTELSPAEIDSLVACWNEALSEQAFQEYYSGFFSVEDTYIDPSNPAASIPDSVYIRRLQALASPVQLPYNDIVKSVILRYLNNKNGLVGRILSLSKYYFPIIEDELLREGLPIELRMLPVIESALAPTAISRAGAGGLWQFMPSTGKNYGLEVNTLVDERFAPLTSTRAACKYLRDLYSIYNDWTLAIAAYNCGPGNVNKALARAGKNCKTFWDVYYYLPSETRSYVPAFIAASYVCAYHKQHGIEVDPSPLPVATDTVTVNRIMHLEQVSSTIEVPIDMLRQLNPQYKMDIIPATNRSYALILPIQFISRYVENENEIMAKDSTYLKEFINPANIDKKRIETQVTTYTVKSGDTLGKIAARHHVTVKDLMRWNGLKSDRLRIGQKLKIEKKR